MKTIARNVWAVAVLGVGLLVFFGAPPLAARTGYAEPVYDLIVVQSSVGRKLSQADLEQLHDAVARFLAGQGPVRSGEYIVRIDFPPAGPGAAAEWMIVKLTNLPPPAFSLAGDNPTDESDYNYGYDSGYAYSPYGYYDPFNPYFNGDYWPSGGIPFRTDRHWRSDRYDHKRDVRARNDGRPDFRDQTGEPRPIDMSKRPRVTYTRIDDQSGAHRHGERDDSSRNPHSRNEAQSGPEHRLQRPENTPHSPESVRWRDTGSTVHPSPLSSGRTARNSFVPPPPPVRIQSPPPASTSQGDRDNGNRKHEP